jgi:HAE1 family hydrophobic/amphiphilic exporter-1
MRRAAAGAVLLGALVATPCAAQEESLPPRIGVSGGPPQSLTLDAAVRLALEQNNDVAIARLETDASRQDIQAALGVFDPRFLPTFGYRHSVSPVANSIGGASSGKLDEKRGDATATLAGLSPWAGGSFAVDFTASKVQSSNTNLRLNPQFPSFFGASYTQPLVRGRRIDVNRYQVLISRKAADLTDQQLTLVLMDQLSLVEQAYWDLVFATGNLGVQLTALAQARSQVDSNERQVREGRLAPIDVVEAQTQVAIFAQTVATARQSLTAAENRLKSLMLSDRHQPLWSLALTPDAPNDRPLPALSLEDAVRLAMTRRPELSSVDVTLAQNALDQELFADQTKPRVDLTGQYTLSGLAGTSVTQPTNPLGRTDPALLARLNDLSLRAGLADVELTQSTTTPLPPFLIGGLGDSLANVLNRRFPTALVQVSLDMPLGNRTAKANLAKSRIAETGLKRQRQQLEQAIEAEVRNALQAVQSADQRLAAASSQRHDAEEQYASERRRFDSGLSTVFLVLQRQQTLVTAQALELRARTDLNAAVAIFDRAVGATLEQHGVRIEPRAS